MKKLKDTTNQKMDPLDDLNPQVTGARFMVFRKFLAISQTEIAKALSIRNTDLQKIENGDIKENIFIPLCEYLYKEYGLNINWLTCGEGFAFSKKGPKTPEDIFKFLQRLNNPETASLFLSFIIYPLIENVFKQMPSKSKNPIKKKTKTAQKAPSLTLDTNT